jgi:acyl carrier protein
MTTIAPDSEAVLQRVTEVLEQLFEIDPDTVKPEARLYEDLDIDSIDAVDLVIELKKITGRKIQPDDFKSVRTVEDIVNQVVKLLNEN